MHLTPKEFESYRRKVKQRIRDPEIRKYLIQVPIEPHRISRQTYELQLMIQELNGTLHPDITRKLDDKLQAIKIKENQRQERILAFCNQMLRF